MEFKDRLKQLLDEKGVTKTQMSKDTGISVYRINTWLKGTKKPNSKYLIPISDYFNVSTDFLFGRKDKHGNKLP